MKNKLIILTALIVLVVSTSSTIPLFAQNKTSARSNNNTLVVFLSWARNLAKMSHWIDDETDGDLRRVTIKEVYPDNYNKIAAPMKRTMLSAFQSL